MMLWNRTASCFIAAVFATAVLCGKPAPGAPNPAEVGGAENRHEEKVLSANGGWGYNGPHAVLAAGKLFWSYMDTQGMVWAASYSPASGELHRTGVWQTHRDLHQASPVLIRPDGRIQMFVNKGGVYTDEEIFWKVSTKPGEIAEFGPLQASKPSGVPQGRQFYPLVHEPSGDVYLIVNAMVGPGNRRIGMWRSTDGGDTLEEYHVLYGLADDLRNNRCYTRAYLEGNDIHFVAVRVGHGETVGQYKIPRIEGVYYIRYGIRAKAFYRADGTRSFDLADAPVYDTKYFDAIWDWEKDGDKRQRAFWSDIVAKEGRPYVTFAVQDAVPRGESSPHHGYWATPDGDGRWRTHKVAGPMALGIFDTMPPNCNLSIAIDPERPEHVFLSKSTSEDGLLSEVHRMATADGGRTWESVEVLSGQSRISTLAVPQRIDDTPRDFDVLWLSGPMNGWSGYKTRIMTHRKSDIP